MTIAPTWTEPLRRQSQKLQRQWRTLPLLDRWLFAEMLGPLLFGIAAFTAVSLSVGVVFELVRKVAEAGLPLWAAGKVLALRMPGFLVLSFPMATLMATLLAFSRLSGSSELTALRSIGVKTWRMVVPALVLAALMTLLTFVFNDVIVPSANYSASNVLDSAHEIKIPIAENVIPNRRRPSRFVTTRPISIEPPVRSENAISVINPRMKPKKKTIAMNLPTIICVIDIGAETSIAIV